MTGALQKAKQLEENILKVIVGKHQIVRLSLIPLLCRSHLLLEDVPGVGKTTLAKALAKSIAGVFKRVQFTPDLLPLDITGSYIYNQRIQEFELKQGPVFTNVLLADEINRATPRTQSSLLECMEEFQVSLDGRTHPVPDVFLVIATQNPIEQTGTFELPETQLDRFMLRLEIGYPGEAEEIQIFDRQAEGHPLDTLGSVLQLGDVLELRRAVQQIFVHATVKEYISRIVRQTRKHQDVLLGASPRGTLSLIRASQAFTFLCGQTFVAPDAVKVVAPAVLAHRLVLKPQASLRGIRSQDVVRSILEEVDVPVDVKA